MDPWRDKDLEKRTKEERKFSLKNKTDLYIVLTIGGFILFLVIVLIIILVFVL